MDLRIKKTINSIINAFIELRSQKNLEKITIKELCEKAEINKSTFYSHYCDIYALSDTLEAEVVDSVIQSLGHPEYVLENPGDFTRELFLACRSNDSLIQILFTGNQSGNLIIRMEQSIKKLIFQTHPEYADDPAINILISYKIFGAYYAYQTNLSYGLEQVVAILSQITTEIVDILFKKDQTNAETSARPTT